MKSIRRKDFIGVGTVIRSHGTRGEVKIRLSSQDIRFKEWAFLEIQGKPVPFKIRSVSGTEDEPLLHFEDINSVPEAVKLCNCQVLLPKRSVKRKDTGETLDVDGYLLIDETAGEIGIVESLEEYPYQLLFQTTYKGKEILIPAADDFIVDVDDQKKIIYLDLPEGLL